MSKQSSIEWLIDQVEEGVASVGEWRRIKEKAVQMHKEEIESAYCDGGVGVRDKTYKGMHEYYQKTYGGDTK